MQPIDTGYRPRAQQRLIHDAVAANRFTVVVAHRRMGKTVAAINQMIHSALTNTRAAPRYAYIAPTYAQAKRVAFDYLQDFTRPLGAEANIAELRVDFFRRRISLYGSDHADSLRGQYFDGVVLDEFGDQNPRIWTEVVRPALADRGGWALIIGTPRGDNHFRELRDRAARGDGWGLLEFKASATGVLEPTELAAARLEMGEDRYAQEFECSFDAPAVGSYYATLLKDTAIQHVPRDGLARLMTAWDLGMGDSTAIWVAQPVGQEVRLIDYHENHGVGLDHYVSWLREHGYADGDHVLPHDVEVRELGTGKSRREMLEEAGLNIRVAPKLALDDGIQAVRRLLPRCFFDRERCGNGITALKNYRREYDDRRKMFYDRPFHDWTSHAADALRYLALGLDSTPSWGQPLKVNKNWIV